VYKVIVSIILWPIWFCFLLACLLLISIALLIIPKNKLFLIIRPISWLICFFAGQWLIKENGPPDPDGQPYLYLFNHVSMFDQFMIGAYVPHYITAIGATEIFQYPIWGRVIKRYGGIPIHRRKLKKAIKSLMRVELKIKEGISFIIAPEGTRTTSGEMGPFKKGPFHVAKNTGVTIVPIALIGGLKAKTKADWRLRPGIIKTIFGKPIYQSEYSALSVEDLRDLVKSRIQNLIYLEGENEHNKKK